MTAATSTSWLIASGAAARQPTPSNTWVSAAWCAASLPPRTPTAAKPGQQRRPRCRSGRRNAALQHRHATAGGATVAFHFRSCRRVSQGITKESAALSGCTRLRGRLAVPGSPATRRLNATTARRYSMPPPGLLAHAGSRSESSHSRSAFSGSSAY
jgi:hypothetical protein